LGKLPNGSINFRLCYCWVFLSLSFQGEALLGLLAEKSTPIAASEVQNLLLLPCLARRLHKVLKEIHASQKPKNYLAPQPTATLLKYGQSAPASLKMKIT
jgi:hypothetical protein